MKTTSILWTAAYAVCLGCGQAPAPSATPDTVAGGTTTTSDGGADDVIGRKILHRKEIAELPGKEGVMYVSSLPAGQASGRHTHPGPELSYVISGRLHIDNEGNPDLSRDVGPGESFSSPAGKVHNVKNIGNEPVKIVTVIILDKGALLATPVAQ